MTFEEIIAELPKLSADDRRVILHRLDELYDQDLAAAGGPSESEKRILDECDAAFERDGDLGEPLDEVLTWNRCGDGSLC